ncbi:MgtC/SapB family protein [Tardiphaga sp. 1201_B9_N1_1]|uniref:MgtC/SapB family protein n=1 Tax=unclassified Tardiphaga TaxID=2631404 RepID=UPI000E74268C|nr:MgtC/SapB family protein [Tardiphaga sp. 37S4]UFS78442.1 MgtC/SapB family protein [Tardiphaga sp. 37S4]
MLDWSDIILRLGIAALVGGAIGLNRDLHGKPVGVRTLGLVSLATAMIVVLADPLGKGGFTDAGSRVIQGILTGVGFLGAGVIFHAERHFRVRGLTSAACVWLTACVGIMCGAGHWRIVTVSVVIAFLVLLLGGRIERALHRVLGGKGDPASVPMDAPQSSDAGPHQPGK